MEDWPRPKRLRVVGLDLAWSPRNPTGGCVAAWDGRVARLVEPPRADLGGKEEIVDYVRAGVQHEPAVVAIDCPLAVPNDSGLRACDRLMNDVFRRFEAGVHPANRHTLSRYDGLRGERLAASLAAERFSLGPRSPSERNVIEVYPHAAMITLIGLTRTLKYKSRQTRGYAERWRELAKLQRLLAGLRTANPRFLIDDAVLRQPPKGIRGAALKRLEDALDALICAYVGLVYGVERFRKCAMFGDRDGGHILVPMSEEFRRSMPPSAAEHVLFRSGRA